MPALLFVGAVLVTRAVDARWWYRGVSLLLAPIGIVERVPVYTILAWQVFSAVVLLTRPAGRDDG